MPTPITKVADFGPAYAGVIGTIVADFYYGSGSHAVGPYSGVAGDIVQLEIGQGRYRVHGTLPDGFSEGFVVWDPGDGRAKLLDEVFLPSANVSLTGLGSEAVMIHLRDDIGGPVQNVLITVLDSTGSNVLAWSAADVSGNRQFMLDPGTYKVNITTTAGYDSLAQQTLVVTVPATVTYVINRHVSGVPPTPGLCVVEFNVREPGNGFAVVQGAIISGRLLDRNETVPGALLSLSVPDAVSDVSGYGALQLVIGKNYRITVTSPDGAETYAMKEVSIPDAASVSFDELL